MLPTICGLVLLCGAAAEKDNPPPEKAKAVRVECSGKLRHGVVAIGGETTGTTVAFDGMIWELNLTDDAARKFAQDHHKKAVIVVGTLRQVSGPERGIRWIVDVERLSARDEAQQKEGAIAALTGIVQKPQGAPSNRVVEVGAMSWLLDFGEDKTFEAKADSLMGETVSISGAVRKDGPARIDKDPGPVSRLWLRVQTLEPAAAKTALK